MHWPAGKQVGQLLVCVRQRTQASEHTLRLPSAGVGSTITCKFAFDFLWVAHTMVLC